MPAMTSVRAVVPWLRANRRSSNPLPGGGLAACSVARVVWLIHVGFQCG